jgi:hypothetical protein
MCGVKWHVQKEVGRCGEHEGMVWTCEDAKSKREMCNSMADGMQAGERRRVQTTGHRPACSVETMTFFIVEKYAGEKQGLRTVF